MRRIRRVIIHCSDSDVPSHDDISVIRRWHVEERGWSDVGYHFFIRSTGEIQRGRPIEHQGSHCAGHNADSIGICLHGRKHFTVDQFASLRRLCKVLLAENNSLTFHGHCEFSPKSCPNFDYKMILQFSDNDPKTEKRV